MKIKNITGLGARCDIGICDKEASYTITSYGVTYENELHICEHCLIELYSILKAHFRYIKTPSSDK